MSAIAMPASIFSPYEWSVMVAQRYPRATQAFTIDASDSAPSLQVECIWKSPAYAAG